MVSKEIDYLKSKNFDIYKLLEIPNDAQDATIRKAYRKQALIYHPDKNPSDDAADKFHAISISLTVLSDKQLRNEYDNWLQSKQLEALRSLKLDASRRQMKDELEKAETEAAERQYNKKSNDQSNKWSTRVYKESSDKFGLNLEALRQEGAQQRRDLEEEYRTKLNNNQDQDAVQPKKMRKVELNDNTKVKVRWKIKEGISDLFTSDVLIGIMSVFGDIESAEIIPRPSKETRYDTGIVKFKTIEGALEAVKHDFNERKSQKWEKTSYRKLSGLLREIKWDKKAKKIGKVGILNQDNFSFDDYLQLTLTKLSDAKDSTSLKRKLEQ